MTAALPARETTSPAFLVALRPALVSPTLSAQMAATFARHEANRTDGTWSEATSLAVAPNLWSGVGPVRGGAGTALVGSHAEVAHRIAEYAEIGLDEFIFSGYPHLEELYWFGAGVVPILRERGLFNHGIPRGGADSPQRLDPGRRVRALTTQARRRNLAEIHAWFPHIRRCFM